MWADMEITPRHGLRAKPDAVEGADARFGTVEAQARKGEHSSSVLDTISVSSHPSHSATSHRDTLSYLEGWRSWMERCVTT